MIFSKSFHDGFELGKELADYRRLGTPDHIARALDLCEEEISKLKAELARAKNPVIIQVGNMVKHKDTGRTGSVHATRYQNGEHKVQVVWDSPGNPKPWSWTLPEALILWEEP